MATYRPGGTPNSARLVGVLLAAVAALYVIAPAMQSATVPLVQDELGLSRQDEAVARVVGTTVALLSLAAAGRIGDVRGRRQVLTASLTVLCAGCLLLTVAFSAWSYVLGRIVVAGALAAVFVSCLAFMPSVYLPGRVGRIMAGWLTAMSAGFVAAVSLAPYATSVAGWRMVMAVMTVVAAAAVPLVRRYLPATPPARRPLSDPVLAAGWAAVGVLAAAALQLGPVWGWSDRRVGALLLATGAALLFTQVRGRRAALRRVGGTRVAGPVWAATLTTGIVLGFTQVVLTAAVPPLTVASGGSPESGALALSAFGMGGAAACLVVRRGRIAPLAGGSLGLPLAALGLVLLHTVMDRTAHPVPTGSAVVAIIGFGIMLALTPQMSRFLIAIPRTHLGTNAALLPGAILLGSAAAQAFPYTSATAGAAPTGDVRHLLWVGTAVVAAAAVVLGRPTVAVTVTAAAGLQYVLATTHPNKSVTICIALAVGAGVGGAAWLRREQADRLSRTRKLAETLQHAVLHPVPRNLGRLHLASLYRPATADVGIGGDFLEAVHTPFGTRILIGDVRGKGLPAVRSVADLLGCFRSQAYETPDLGELAARLDRQVMRAAAAGGDDELFATALILQHDARAKELHIVNCGHLAPLAVTASGTHEIDVPVRLPLGFGAFTEAAGADAGAESQADGAGDPAAPDTPPTPCFHRFPLGHHTTLVAHTDGLNEARNSTGEFYPVTAHLADAPHGHPDNLVRHLDDSVRDWTHHLADDIAVIALTPVRHVA